MSETRTGTLAGLRTAGPRPGRARWGLALLVATALGCVAACAGPPSSGPYATATLNHDQNQIRITPKKPYPGIGPQKLVQAFLAATAGDDGDPTFGVAQEYFADNLGSEWAAQPTIKDGEATIYAKDSPTTPFRVDAPVYDPPQAAAPSPGTANAPGQTATVALTFTQMASLGKGGFYKLSATQQQVPVQFHLEKVKVGSSKDLQWRITEKPDKRLISIDDLRRAYQALPVFQPSDNALTTNTATVGQIYVVPSDTRRTYQALAEALLRGPAGDAADPGVEVTPNLSSGTVTVKLAKVPMLQSGQPKWDAAALLSALAETFQAAAPSLQLGGGATTFTTLLLKEPGRPDASHLLSATSSSPDYPAIYYASQGSIFGASGSSPGASGNLPAVLDVAASGRTFGKIAVRSEQPGGDDAGRPSGGAKISIAAVVTKGADVGDIVVYSKLDTVKNTAGAVSALWYRPAKAQLVTDLTWDPIDGSLWIVDDGHLYNVQAPEGGHPSAPTPIDAPVGADPFQRIRISPDGRQAVVVTGSHVDDPSSDAPTSALLTDIVRPDAQTDARSDARTDTMNGPSRLKLQRRFALQPTTAGSDVGKLHIADVTWAGGRTIVLLAKEPGGAPPKLYKVYVDGSQDGRLVEGVEQAEGQGTTRIAASASDPGGLALRIFSNGLKADDGKPGIYWKGKTFDLLQPGDNPTTATMMVSGN